jgi:hypothetical protein
VLTKAGKEKMLLA